MKVFVFDSAKCNGCRNCQLACKDEHCDKDWPPFAKAQPDIGQFWLKVDEKIRGQVPKVRISYTVRLCQHCGDAPCAKACSQDAFQRRDDGLLILNYEKCNGCMDCVPACPYDAIYANSELGIAQKCTGCAHLLDDGHEVPHCVDVCPHEAFRFGEEADFVGELDEAEALYGLTELQSHVYYLNLPKRFIGGTVIDPDADEVLIGAEITLENLGTGAIATTKSDDFGDFWFKQIEAAEYRLYFEYEGYMVRVLEVDVSEIDKNIGCIDLYPNTME